MSLENAKKLIEKLKVNDELREKFVTDSEAAFAEKDYGCTIDELKEAEALGMQLDEDELTTITGGTAFTCNPYDPDCDMHGGCTAEYYVEECTATVESGSCCWSDDLCIIFDSNYTRKY